MCGRMAVTLPHAAMVQMFGGKINDLKNLYGFRLLLEKKSAEYQQAPLR